jgi:hypothetical protein
MPTVYYTDGTFEKYERYEDILKDPYLKLDPKFFIKKEYESINRCDASYFQYYYTLKNIHTLCNCKVFERTMKDCSFCSFKKCVEKSTVLQKVKIKEIKERINKTNSINICGLMEYIGILKMNIIDTYIPFSIIGCPIEFSVSKKYVFLETEWNKWYRFC